MALFSSDHLGLAALLLCVPLQMAAVHFLGSSENVRIGAIQDTMYQAKSLISRWLRVDAWRKWVFGLIFSIQHGDLTGESPAVEVFRYRQKDGYFAHSTETRVPRPSHVQFRVGQVVRHKQWDYTGVIIGWDLEARAPTPWLDKMHGAGNERWRKQPNYALLVDTRDRAMPQTTYVPQENLELLRHTSIEHPSVESYFDDFDGSVFLPRPWLRSLYPRD